MTNKESIKQMEQLLYKKCCNYACECRSDALREILGEAANDARIRLNASGEELTDN